MVEHHLDLLLHRMESLCVHGLCWTMSILNDEIMIQQGETVNGSRFLKASQLHWIMKDACTRNEKGDPE